MLAATKNLLKLKSYDIDNSQIFRKNLSKIVFAQAIH